jgi:outer membrane biosynthesis protein TonB
MRGRRCLAARAARRTAIPLSYTAYDTRRRDDVVAIPRIWLTLLLSLLLHGLALWLVIPQLPNLRQGSNALADATGRLAVQLTPSPAAKPVPPSPPAAAGQAPPPPRATPPMRKVTPAPPPPKTVLTSPAAPIPAPIRPPPVPEAPPPPVATPPAPPPLDGDLASYIAARRRARGESGESTTGDSAADAEKARRDRLVAMNLGSSTKTASTFGEAPKNGGGTFQLRTVEYDAAEFTFYGWNKDINRRAFQVIEVRRGNNPDINTAIIRKIIAIIREHEQGDFHWDSKRLGRDLTLSARAADNAALEAFMMEEFFTSGRQPR